MRLVSEHTRALDLSTTPVHLGLGSRALPVEGFGWSAEILDAYSAAVAGDGAEGRLVMLFSSEDSWTGWERHPAGDELVICISGHVTLIRAGEGADEAVELRPGEAAINPAGTWHTADIHTPSQLMTITPGTGTEHRPR